MPGAGTSTANQNVAKTSAESGTTANTQNQSSNTNTGPWGATSGLLGNIIGSLNGLSGNTNPSPQQSEAVANLQSSANQIPNFGSEAAGAVNPLLNGTYGGMLTGALGDYKSNLSPYLSSSYLNPMSTPGLSDALGTVRNDVTNQVNDQFAAAGRDLSPANTTALARGLTQGMAPIITDQFNRNVNTQRGAQDALYGAGSMTPGMLANLTSSGINAAGAVPGLYTAPGSAQLGAANTAYSMPYSNLGMLSGLTLPIAGLGQTSNSSSTGNNTGTYNGTGNSNAVGNSSQTMSPIQQFTSLFGGAGGGAAGNFLGMLSDIDAKENVKQVGMLYDGTPTFSYNYKGDDTPQIGLIAQDVEKRAPDAVREIGGLKHVDYGKATERSRAIGMLSDLKLAV